MKKFLMAMFALVVATSVATAGVGIQWSTQNWGEYHDGSGDAILQNNSTLWQLIYAGADNTADAIDDTMNKMDPVAWAANDYLRPGGDDALWAERTIAQGGGTAPEDGTLWDEWLSAQSGSVVYENLAWSTAGYVYQRVFEVGAMGVPAGSTWFYETSLFEYNENYSGGGSPTEEFYVDSPVAPFTPDRQVATIPEPATMALLGLGALGLALRRRRK